MLVLNAGNIAGEAANTSYRAPEARLRDEAPPEVDSGERAVDGARHRRLLRRVAADRPEGGAGARAALRLAHARRADDVRDRLVRAEGGQSAHRRRDRHGVQRHARSSRTAGRPQRVDGERAGRARASRSRSRPSAPRTARPTSRSWSRTRSRSARRSRPRRACASSSRCTASRSSCSRSTSTAAIEYWQIEESNWTSAPLLANPTATFTYHGPHVRGVHERRPDPDDRRPLRQARLLGAEHDPQQPVEPDDDRDRRESPAATTERPVTARRMARIAIFGAGYVGLVTGACFADLGHDVVLRDVVPERVERLRAGEVPIYEPGLDDVIARNRERISFTLDVREAVDGAEFLYVAVGTPPTYSGDADLSRGLDGRRRASRRTAGRPLLVMKSTVPVGTGEQVRARARRARPRRRSATSRTPSSLAEGTAIARLHGARPRRRRRVRAGRRRARRRRSTPAIDDAESSAWTSPPPSSSSSPRTPSSSTRISFINEIANVCELVGADVVDVARGDRPRPPPRPALPPAGHRLRRLVLPEGRHSRSSSSPATRATRSSSCRPCGR